MPTLPCFSLLPVSFSPIPAAPCFSLLLPAHCFPCCLGRVNAFWRDTYRHHHHASCALFFFPSSSFSSSFLPFPISISLTRDLGSFPANTSLFRCEIVVPCMYRSTLQQQYDNKSMTPGVTIQKLPSSPFPVFIFDSKLSKE